MSLPKEARQIDFESSDEDEEGSLVSSDGDDEMADLPLENEDAI